jgi:hypothetical protein
VLPTLVLAVVAAKNAPVLVTEVLLSLVITYSASKTGADISQSLMMKKTSK